jgi:hypothetical protein
MRKPIPAADWLKDKDFLLLVRRKMVMRTSPAVAGHEFDNSAKRAELHAAQAAPRRGEAHEGPSDNSAKRAELHAAQAAPRRGEAHEGPSASRSRHLAPAQAPLLIARLRGNGVRLRGTIATPTSCYAENSSARNPGILLRVLAWPRQPPRGLFWASRLPHDLRDGNQQLRDRLRRKRRLQRFLR